ncbi:hypothetical protein [Nocardioides sp. TF02-7]|uniref:hypothetical protein n=1 Tax=Nocardioides sp. TF02-7 TaxID=2917724 RepID=UPI001F06C11A|nr:hypothetical protein [Nocardioides sp. TF02-7]UMG94455.1 hypothetical protein MF408_10990 [Nocardioides sp. TF02-7]
MRWQALALGATALVVAGCGQPLLAEGDVDGAVAATEVTGATGATGATEEDHAVNDLDAETVLIGHALGTVDVDGKPRAATNSLEAAEQSYAEGLRLLEEHDDLVLVTDTGRDGRPVR